MIYTAIRVTKNTAMNWNKHMLRLLAVNQFIPNPWTVQSLTNAILPHLSVGEFKVIVYATFVCLAHQGGLA